jgi:hypothetical protein
VSGQEWACFSRYAKVLGDDDSAMSVRMALSLVNRVWEEIESELDTNSALALAWFATYGFDTRGSRDLIIFANAKDVPSTLSAMSRAAAAPPPFGRRKRSSPINWRRQWPRLKELARNQGHAHPQA